jgi:glycosyltransferase involved in cell wall biosynthesis
VGIVPYIPVPGDPMYYADSSKVKEYIQAGIPIVIITNVPEVAVEIEGETAGFAVEYAKDEIAKAMIRLLTDDRLWRDYGENVRKLSTRYDCVKIYDAAFRGSGIDE